MTRKKMVRIKQPRPEVIPNKEPILNPELDSDDVPLIDQILMDQDGLDLDDVQVQEKGELESQEPPPATGLIDQFETLLSSASDEGTAPTIKSPTLDDLDYAIMEWLTRQNSLTSEVKTAVSKVLDDSVIKIKVFMYALAQHKIRRMLYLFSKLAKIEDKMFSDEKLDSEVIPLKDLFKMFTLISTEISKYSDFLKNLPSPDKDVYGVLLDSDEEETLSKLPQESKEKIKKVLKKLLS